MSDSMMRLGFVVGPPIELNTSEEYNARFPRDGVDSLYAL